MDKSAERDQLCMEVLQLAGRIIMENGGETYRTEETVCRMGYGLGLTDVESFAVPSGLFISYRQPDGQLETSVKRIHRKGTNLMRIDEVNRVSRLVTSGDLDLMDALSRLREIESLPGPVRTFWLVPAAFVCAAGFGILFGGTWNDWIVAGMVAAIVQSISLLIQRFHMQWQASAIAGGFLTSLLPHLIYPLFSNLSMEIIIAGALMPLVPGIAMTNAVQDTMRGDMVSGLSHGTQAALTACLIAGGALLSAALFRLLENGGFL